MLVRFDPLGLCLALLNAALMLISLSWIAWVLVDLGREKRRRRSKILPERMALARSRRTSGG